MFDEHGNPIMAAPTFPDLGAPAGDQTTEAGAATPPPAEQIDLATLAARFDDLQGRYDNLVTTVANRPAPAPVAPVSTEPEPTLDLITNMPDPVQDLAGYNREAQNRVQAFVQSTTQRATQSVRSEMSTTNNRADAANRFESTFRTEYADLAGKPLLLQTALAAEARERRARGEDPIAAIAANPSAVAASVAKRMRDELGTPSPTPGVTTTVTTTPPANRTGGVSGGTRPAASSATGAPQKPMSFVAAMQKAQSDSGIL